MTQRVTRVALEALLDYLVRVPTPRFGVTANGRVRCNTVTFDTRRSRGAGVSLHKASATLPESQGILSSAAIRTVFVFQMSEPRRRLRTVLCATTVLGLVTPSVGAAQEPTPQPTVTSDAPASSAPPLETSAPAPTPTPMQPSESSATPARVEATGAPQEVTAIPRSASPTREARTEEASPNEKEKTEKKTKKNKRKKGERAALEGDTAVGRIRLKGRVFARATLQREERSIVGTDGVPRATDVESLDLAVRSARIGAKYRAPLPWLRAEVEVELARRARLRDGYLQAKGTEFAAQAGQFKVPLSRIELDSAFTVPVVERGNIRELLLDWMDVAGRRPGIALEWRSRTKPKPSLLVGAFQGSRLVAVNPGDRDTEYAFEDDRFTQSLVGRAGLDFGKVEVDAYYEHRVGSPVIGRIEHYPTAGADVFADVRLGSGALRLWLNGMAGASWYEHSGKPADDDDATFMLGRAIVGYRFGGLEEEAFYVEPFAMFGWLDPDLDVVDDPVREAAAGVNVGLWERARVGIQGEWAETGRNLPEGLTPATVPMHLAVLLQAGLVF
jgi:hypothetical protein